MIFVAGLGLTLTSGLVVYGAMTGRLAAMLAAVFKPGDLAQSGSYIGGTPDTGTNAATTSQQDVLLMAALIREARSLGATNDPSWKKTVEPLVVKATNTNKVSDLNAAIDALRALIAKYKSNVGQPGATQGANTDPSAGQAPIVAPAPITPATIAAAHQ